MISAFWIYLKRYVIFYLNKYIVVIILFNIIYVKSMSQMIL